MSLSDIAAVLRQVPSLVKVKRAVNPLPATTRDSLAARLEQTAARFPDHPAVIFEGEAISWRELNARTNRYAATLKALGLKRGNAVSLVMENRIEFLTSLLALNKLGAIAALINTNLTGRSLVHCIKI
ncbi:MAG: AMP-binding protein, partial [Pseudomonadota bacterium]